MRLHHRVVGSMCATMLCITAVSCGGDAPAARELVGYRNVPGQSVGSISLPDASNGGAEMAFSAAPGELLIAYFGLRFAAKAKAEHDVRYTFGLRRIEILAALTNGFLLIGICIYIVMEAVRRMMGDEHSHVDSELMLYVAIVGFIANAISAFYLHRSEHITTRSAYLHVITDLLSSLGVIIAAVVIELTGWELIDPLISIAIAIMITRGAVRVIRQAAVILMESAPSQISPVELRQVVAGLTGIVDVHDVHVWQLGMKEYSASLHVVSDLPTDDVVSSVRAALHDKYGLSHITVQVESSSTAKGECGAC